MRFISSALFIALAAVGSGCSSPPAKPERPPYDAVAPDVVGTTVPSGSLRSIREPENCRSYQVGRYIDPNNPNAMYEATTLYIVTDSASWNKRPNMPAMSPQFNKVLTTPNPVSAELQLHVETLKETNTTMNKLASELVKSRQALKTAEKKISDDAKDSAALREELSKMKEEQAEICRKLADLAGKK